jgi:hypothetical protein
MFAPAAHRLHILGYLLQTMPAAGFCAILIAVIVAAWLAWRILRRIIWLCSRRNRQMLPFYRQQAQYWQERAARAPAAAEARQYARAARYDRRAARWWQP